MEGRVKIAAHTCRTPRRPLGEEWSGYSGMLSDNLERIEDALQVCIVWRLAERP